MNEQRKRVVAIGEVMVEMARGGDGRFGMGCGGDTFNTAVYLARAGIDVAYATALGDDPYSDGIVSLAVRRGHQDRPDAARARPRGRPLPDRDRQQGRAPLHLLARERAGARAVRIAAVGPIAESMLSARLIYFSGITLSLYSNNGLGRFLAILEMARQQGVKVAFDGNFRPRGWKGDLGRTRTVFNEALKRVDIALPTYDDEAVLWGDPSPEATVERLQAFGIGEIVVKNGPNSALVSAGGRQEYVPPPEVVVPVDTTAAGDSFNAGYMAARLSGENPAAAATAAHRLAGEKIRHRGAIMPRAAAAMH